MKKTFVFILPIFIYLMLNILSPIFFPYGINFNKYTTFGDINYSQKNGCDIVNIGSSHGEENFYYKDESVNGLNFGISAGNLYYGRMILEEYDYAFNENTVIAIPLSYFHFIPYSSSNVTRYMKLLQKSRLQEDVSLTDYVVTRYFKAVGINKYQFLTTTAIKHFTRPSVTSDSHIDYQDDEAWQGHARGRLNGHLKYADASQEVKQQYVNELIQIINFQQAKNRRVVIIFPPYYKYYNELIDVHPYMVEFYQTLNNILDTYNLELFDYSHDSRFTDTREYFINTDHLNQDGAKLFTHILLEDLEII